MVRELPGAAVLIATIALWALALALLAGCTPPLGEDRGGNTLDRAPRPRDLGRGDGGGAMSTKTEMIIHDAIPEVRGAGGSLWLRIPMAPTTREAGRGDCEVPHVTAFLDPDHARQLAITLYAAATRAITIRATDRGRERDHAEAESALGRAIAEPSPDLRVGAAPSPEAVPSWP